MLNGVKFETPSQAGLPPMLVNSYDATFSPRVGAAWQPFGKSGHSAARRGGPVYLSRPDSRGSPLINRNNPFTVGYSRELYQLPTTRRIPIT